MKSDLLEVYKKMQCGAQCEQGNSDVKKRNLNAEDMDSALELIATHTRICGGERAR
jgi:hypothetical protein